MPNAKKLKKVLSRFPRKSGIYMMRNKHNDIIYVGKARDLKQRVSNYLNKALDNKTMALMNQVKNIEYKTTASETKALLLESRVVRERQPKYNVRLRDDKSFPCLAVSREEFPRVFLTRELDADKNREFDYLGPFISSGNLRAALKSLQRIFRFRTCNNLQKKGCLLYHIKLCSAPCLNLISHEDYQENIQLLKEFLQGNMDELKSSLVKKATTAAGQGNAKKAYGYRYQMDMIDRLGSREPAVPAVDKSAGLKEIQQALGMKEPPYLMAAVDISDIKGTAAVGAVVTFRDGIPDKDGYRRYRIKTAIEGQADDYYRIREVMSRYVNRKIAEQHNFPDIILIDGGKGHLAAVAGIFNSGILKPGIKMPVLLALAKKKEMLYICRKDKIDGLSIPAEGMKILQYLRDEAHRFAQAYHHLLRKKALVRK